MAASQILVIYPEPEITKIAVYRNNSLVFLKTLKHKPEQLAAFAKVTDELDFRSGLILQELQNNQIDFDDIAIIMARGGLLKPLKSGVYQVNEAMKADLRKGVMGVHATNLGGLIADNLVKHMKNARAFLADPVVVDELQPLARVSGLPGIERNSVFHALNHFNISREYANSINRSYKELRTIIAYIGNGGVSVGAHLNGQVVDVNQAFDGDGPFSLTRSGGLPVGQLIDLCYNGKHTREQMHKLITENGGLKAYLGTRSLSEVLALVEEGDSKARFYIEAMAYQIAKEVGSMAAVLEFEVDAVLVMGAILNNRFFTDCLIRRIERIAPISLYPIVNDLDSLAANGSMILRGEVAPQEYQ